MVEVMNGDVLDEPHLLSIVLKCIHGFLTQIFLTANNQDDSLRPGTSIGRILRDAHQRGFAHKRGETKGWKGSCCFER